MGVSCEAANEKRCKIYKEYIINHVINKFKTLKPELYDKIKHHEEKNT